MNRRYFIISAGSIAALGVSSRVMGSPAGWPDRSVRLIVPYAPGGASDTQARLVAEKLAGRWGQAVIVENKPGGNEIVAGIAAARAPADGYTLLLVAMPFLFNPVMMDEMPYDPERDFMPVSSLTTIPNVLVAHPSLGVRNVPELVALTKSRPGLMYAVASLGSSTHLSGELFNRLAGTDLSYISYKGSAPAHLDLLAGRVPLMFDNGALQHVRAGNLVALGVTSASRVPWLPDVPTIAEQGLSGYECVAWYGLMARAGTPAELVNRIAADVRWAVQSEDLGPRFETMGAIPMGNTPEAFRKFIDGQRERWFPIIRELGLKRS